MFCAADGGRGAGAEVSKTAVDTIVLSEPDPAIVLMRRSLSVDVAHLVLPLALAAGCTGKTLLAMREAQLMMVEWQWQCDHGGEGVGWEVGWQWWLEDRSNDGALGQSMSMQQVTWQLPPPLCFAPCGITPYDPSMRNPIHWASNTLYWA